MHDAPVVVSDVEVINIITVVFFKVVFQPRDNVVHQNGDVVVPVRSCLLVVEADGMSQLVYTRVVLCVEVDSEVDSIYTT